MTVISYINIKKNIISKWNWFIHAYINSKSEIAHIIYGWVECDSVCEPWDVVTWLDSSWYSYSFLHYKVIYSCIQTKSNVKSNWKPWSFIHHISIHFYSTKSYILALRQKAMLNLPQNHGLLSLPWEESGARTAPPWQRFCCLGCPVLLLRLPLSVFHCAVHSSVGKSETFLE